MNYLKSILYSLVVLCLCISCKNDDDSQPDTNIQLTENVEVYNPDLQEDSFVLAVENGGLTSYLLDKTGHKVKEWVFENNLGNDLELLPNGQLLGMFKVENPDINFGGFGGNIKLLNADSSIAWEYVYASSNTIAHHDVEMLPNGNLLFLAAERIGSISASVNGVNSNIDIFPESLLEINPNTNEIVWEWHSFDHIIQDQVPTALNFGVVNANPQLIDINYNLVENGDIMHANGIDYDVTNDVIYLSVNGYSEVWVIDHSTTTEEASTDLGGTYNKGGNLLYRFGNPEAYQNIVGTRLFHNNHFPNLLEGNEPGAGNVLVYGNGNDINQSTVYELSMPSVLDLIPNENHDPEIIWSFTNPDLYFGKISGAVRLQNGNTLISEGDYGFWEVTVSGEIAWKYNGLGPKFWRCYSYTYDSQEILDLDL